jgi:leucyl-tRNA synthetase
MRDRYEPEDFESKWQSAWSDAELFRTREEEGRPKFYGLDFFPYPSGAGLSVGHCRNYIPTDVLCRMKFMQGYNVLHPMGFDAFGLPAENEAIKRKTHPAPMVQSYADNYRRQMELIGISYDWARSFSSADPTYYRWTQWIFKKLHERGLAERRMAAVNWDPVEKTVLADEEVVAGRGWRSGALVEKKQIPQWFFKITEYAERLIQDLDDLDWPEGIKQMQRNWIGKSEGVEFDLKVVFELEEEPAAPVAEGDLEIVKQKKTPTFRVFTTRIDTIYGMTFCVLAPEHPLVEQILKRCSPEKHKGIQDYRDSAREMSDIDRQAAGREKTGVFTGAHAINPANGKKVPIYVADYVLMGYGTGAIMAVPGHDARDYEFAQKYGIDVVQVISDTAEGRQIELPLESKDGYMVNSGEYSGMAVAEGQEKLGEWMEALEIGERKVNYKLRDWLISRQRYWGCPIPIMYTSEGEEQTVPDDALPVELPDVENYEPSGDGSSPLTRIPDFVNVTDRDGRLGKRETDTMGGFACSSWYFLRFCDPHNHDEPWDQKAVDYWMPVDCYVGGAEHAVMHLLYARFWTKVLYDAGLVPVKEPFQRLMNQGMLLAKTPYRKPQEGEKLGVDEEGIQITFEEAENLPEDEVFYKWDKMSKSKGNVVTPDEAVANYGADALRVFELFVAPFEQTIQWSDEGMQGAVRFLHRVFKLANDLQPHYQRDWRKHIGKAEGTPKKIRRATHQMIEKATHDIDRFAFNTYIASLMSYLNTINDLLKEADSSDEQTRLAFSEAMESLTLVLAPAAPHTADEIWSGLGHEGFTYERSWPKFDPKLAEEDTITIAVQINGKLRDTLEMPAGADKATMEEAAMGSDKVKSHIEGKNVRKVIVVPGKLVNIVAN